jgi:hypothetical protein
MRWRKKWTDKPSQVEMALKEAAGDRLVEMTRGGTEGPVSYVWVKGGNCTVTMHDGTTRPLRIRRRIGTG